MHCRDAEENGGDFHLVFALTLSGSIQMVEPEAP
jgi:hypothetical protein